MSTFLAATIAIPAGLVCAQGGETGKFSGFLLDYSPLKPEKDVAGTPVLRWMNLKDANEQLALRHVQAQVDQWVDTVWRTATQLMK